MPARLHPSVATAIDATLLDAIESTAKVNIATIARQYNTTYCTISSRLRSIRDRRSGVVAPAKPVGPRRVITPGMDEV
jgi:hypothetical protein